MYKHNFRIYHIIIFEKEVSTMNELACVIVLYNPSIEIIDKIISYSKFFKKLILQLKIVQHYIKT